MRRIAKLMTDARRPRVDRPTLRRRRLLSVSLRERSASLARESIALRETPSRACRCCRASCGSTATRDLPSTTTDGEGHTTRRRWRAPMRRASCAAVRKHFGNRRESIPVACCRSRPEDTIQRAKISDRLHVTPVDAEDELAIAVEHLQHPRTTSRKLDRQLRRRTRGSREHADKADDVRTNRDTGEALVRQHRGNVTVRADHDVRIEWKPAREFRAELRAARGPPDHKRPGGADVDNVKVPQLRCELGGPKRSVTADVDASQKDDVGHIASSLSSPVTMAFRASTRWGCSRTGPEGGSC